MNPRIVSAHTTEIEIAVSKNVFFLSTYQVQDSTQNLHQ
jgi:hypothetical protein